MIKIGKMFFLMLVVGCQSPKFVDCPTIHRDNEISLGVNSIHMCIKSERKK